MLEDALHVVVGYLLFKNTGEKVMSDSSTVVTEVIGVERRAAQQTEIGQKYKSGTSYLIWAIGLAALTD